jgi:hypothetical protein
MNQSNKKRQLIIIENIAEIGFIRKSSYSEVIEDDVNIFVSGHRDDGVVTTGVDDGDEDDSVLHHVHMLHNNIHVHIHIDMV